MGKFRVKILSKLGKGPGNKTKKNKPKTRPKKIPVLPSSGVTKETSLLKQE